MLALAILLILLAVAFGGMGLFAHGLTWLLAIAMVLLFAGAFSGYTHYGSNDHHHHY